MKISKIILADDHSFIRLGLIQILKDEYPAATVKEVSDGAALVKEVTINDYDLVISDLDMPGRSGLEALEQIKLIKPDLPVLILSIYPEDLYAIRVLKAGASGYLMKESAPDQLVVAVQRALLGKKYITPAIVEKLASGLDTNSNKLPHENLSDREFEVFKMLATGKSVSQIGHILFLGTTTVSTYRSRILNKMDIKTNAGLTQYAMQNKII